MVDGFNMGLRNKMDDLMNKIIARSIPDPYEKAIISFFEQYLNPVLVQGVIKKYKEKNNIDKIINLTSGDRFQFADDLVKTIFQRIRTKEEIGLLRNQMKQILTQTR